MLSTRLVTPRLFLRVFAHGDAKAVQRLAGDIRIADTMLLIPHPYADGVAEKWIRKSRRAFRGGDAFAFALVTYSMDAQGKTSECHLIGCMSLKVYKHHRSAELGYWIGHPYWNQGFATEAGLAIVRWAFEVRGLERIFATHLSRNPASGRVMQKIGMTHVGRMRRSVYKNDVFEDCEVYEIIRSDYFDRGDA